MLALVAVSSAASPWPALHALHAGDGGVNHSEHVAIGWPTTAEQCSSHGCYPRLFIIGTQKGATTSIFKALKTQGSACGAEFPETWPNLGPQVSDKEAHVFDMSSTLWEKVLERPSQYQELYTVENCPSRYFVDGTPRYMRTPIAAARIPELLPSAWRPQLRFLMSIREPIARDLSWFNHRLSAKARAGASPPYARALTSIQPISLPDAAFCSVPNESPKFPTYEAEVSCRKQELNDCLTLARHRLSKAKAEGGLPTERANKRNAKESAQEAADAARLMDFQWCLELVWPDWDGTNSSKDKDVLKSRRIESPVLAWGMYLPQIRAFVKSAEVARSQLFVLSFEKLVTQPEDSLLRVTQFMGLPEMVNKTLPHTNTQDGEHKVDVISCESRKVLERLYGDWNQMLARGLRSDRESGLAPEHEPKFHGFEFQVPCEHTERAIGIAPWNLEPASGRRKKDGSADQPR